MLSLIRNIWSAFFMMSNERMYFTTRKLITTICVQNLDPIFLTAWNQKQRFLFSNFTIMLWIGLNLISHHRCPIQFSPNLKKRSHFVLLTKQFT